VGLLVANSQSDPSIVVSRVSEMSRAARSYASRLACYDEAAGRIWELSLANGT
jgi:hypothetical protein